MSAQEQVAPSAPTMQVLVDDAISSVSSCELKTGYLDDDGVLHTTACLKEITGEQEDLLTSKKTPPHLRMQKLLEACVESIGTIKAENNPSWSRVIKGLVVTDRLFLIKEIRKISLGVRYAFKTACTHCNEVSDQHVSLDDFKIEGTADPKQRVWSGKLPKTGIAYTAKIQTGFEEEKLAKIQDSESPMTMGVLARLVELGGRQPVTVDMVKRLPSKDLAHLRKEFLSKEGKIDNEIMVDCPSCGKEFKTEIDMGQPSFFFPSEI